MGKLGDGKMIFSDLKVADFCWVGVGPIVGRILAEFGATVIRVESATRPDPLRTMPPFKDNIPGLNRSLFYTGPNCNKRSLALDLNNSKAREVAKKLIAWADIMGESFGPGVMEKWGLGYSEVKRFNPSIIYYSTCMQGQTGPHKNFRGFGLHMAGLSGLYHILGWPDLEPVGPYGAYSDFIAWLWMRAVVLAALDYKRRTGKGQYIDLSQLEATMHFLGPLILEYNVNRRDTSRMGNADKYSCPHGVFPCLGKENWIAIAVKNEDEWRGFCKSLGNPAWCQDPKFATFPLRKANERELNKLIEEWTRQLDAFYLMGLFQSHGVGAGVVLKPSQAHHDPQLGHRPARVTLDHAEIGPHSYATTGTNFSKMSPRFWRAAPLLGEDTQWVLREVLKLSEKEIGDLVAAGAFK
jgi:benzylsuccinate CoA-transferase BbsF subunit